MSPSRRRGRSARAASVLLLHSQPCPALAMSAPLRLAVWSGPRNISTALMRSFGSRADCMVVDEPLYAHYLQSTGLEHPMREEILRRHECDWEKVVADLTGPLEPGKRVFYQKHMAHHLLPHIDRGWLDALTHVFLIRDPRQMLTSLCRVLPEPRIEDTGLPQEVELFEREYARSGVLPPVIDSRDLLLDPPGILAALCARIGITYDPCMLSWESGPRETDGCWGPIWYKNVYASSGFGPYREKSETPPTHLLDLEAQARALYDRLFIHRLHA